MLGYYAFPRSELRSCFFVFASTFLCSFIVNFKKLIYYNTFSLLRLDKFIGMPIKRDDDYDHKIYIQRKIILSLFSYKMYNYDLEDIVRSNARISSHVKYFYIDPIRY